MKKGKPVIGICGGYQMMGDAVVDPDGSESDLGSVEGLHILQGTTTFNREKLTFQVTAECQDLPFVGGSIDARNLTGYEIHMGRTDATGNDLHPSSSPAAPRNPVRSRSGLPAGMAWPGYLHSRHL